MAHGTLYLYEVIAVLDEARGEGAAQIVRCGALLSGDLEPFLENQGDGGFREALFLENVTAPEDSREKRSVLLSAKIQPDKEEFHCRLGQVDLSFLVSLADQRNGTFVEAHVGERESADFGAAQAAAEHERKKRLVARVDDGRNASVAGHQGTAFLHCQASPLRETRTSARLDRPDALQRFALHQTFLPGLRCDALERCQVVVDGGGFEAFLFEEQENAVHVVWPHFFPTASFERLRTNEPRHAVQFRAHRAASFLRGEIGQVEKGGIHRRGGRGETADADLSGCLLSVFKDDDFVAHNLVSIIVTVLLMILTRL